MGVSTMTLEPLRTNEKVVIRPASYFGSWKRGFHLYREVYRVRHVYSAQAIISGPRGVLHFDTIKEAKKFAWMLWGEKAERDWKP